MNILKKENYKWIILIACMLIYCTSQLVRWNYASITKYLIDDLKIGKPELGLLGSAFFYSYALAQIPWGTATDIFGARRVMPIGIGILALFLGGFALSATFTQAMVWRTLMGFVAAAGYVPITAVLAKWFSIKQRGFAMEMYSGVGGGLGEVMTFLLIPIFAVILSNTGIFGLTGWRASTVLMALVIFAISVIAAYLLRSSPMDMGLPSIEAKEDKEEHKSQSYKQMVVTIIKDPALWILSLVWSAYMVATRLVPGWLPLYATEYYIQGGMTKESAMIAGGSMASMYVLGRVFGTPVVGWISDKLLKRNIPRSAVIGVGLLLIALVFYLFTLHMPSTFTLAALSLFAGIVINIFPLINATTSELWSIRSTGFSMGIINMVGQFAGAIALSVSGFMAVKFAGSGSSGFHSEFVGIWYLGIGTSILGALLTLYVVIRERKVVKIVD